MTAAERRPRRIEVKLEEEEEDRPRGRRRVNWGS